MRVPKLGQLIPSGRSVLLGLALLVLACGAYAAALETSVFAVRTIDVRGGTPQIRAEARQALTGELGRSLLRVDGADLDRRLSTLPGVASAQLRPRVPEHAAGDDPRRAAGARAPPRPRRVPRLATGRVLRTLAHPRLSSLPRLWLPSHTQVTVGAELRARAPAQGGGVALASLRGASLPSSVRDGPAWTAQELTLVLASGFEMRLGDPGDIRLKLAIARRIFRLRGDRADERRVPRRQRPRASRARTPTLKSKVELEV